MFGVPGVLGLLGLLDVSGGLGVLGVLGVWKGSSVGAMVGPLDLWGRVVHVGERVGRVERLGCVGRVGVLVCVFVGPVVCAGRVRGVGRVGCLLCFWVRRLCVHVGRVWHVGRVGRVGCVGLGKSFFEIWLKLKSGFWEAG